MQAGLELAGRYRLEESLGRGGFGEVWSAEDLLRDRRVAVKLLYREVAESSPVWLSKFRQEAKIAVRLNHPGITSVDDFGEYDGQWYLVMEFLEGRNLAEEIADHPQGLEISRVQALSVQIADALAAAHEHGIVHRDLKPGNLVLLPGDRVKVCDFGIAHIAEATTTHTLMGQQVGTPAYMAPEQWLGDDVDHRTDLYALGGILYTLLTGRPPFRGTSVTTLMGQHLNLEPSPPRELRPDTPAHLDRLVLALLAKNPADRLTGRQLLDGLNQAVPPPRAEASTQESPASADVWEPVDTDARKILDTDAQKMVDTGVQRMASGDLQSARELLESAARTGHPDQAFLAMIHLGELEEKLRNLPAAQGWYLRAADSGHPEWAPRAMAYLGILEAERRNFEFARSWYQRMVDSGHPDQGPKGMVNLGLLEEKSGNLPAAQYWYLRAANSGHPERSLEAMAYLGALEEDRRNPLAARDWYRRMVGSGHPDYAPEAMVHLGALEEEQGNLQDAWGWYQQAVGTGHPECAPEAMVHLGLMDERQGNIQSAQGWYQRAVDSGHADQAPQAMIHLGALEEEQHRFPAAQYWYLRVANSGHPECGPEAMACLGALEEEQGNLPAARDWYQRVIGSGHPAWTEQVSGRLTALEKRARTGPGRRWFSAR
ncbi:serine/threonine-protein kinase [Actinocorallia sp. B10E7]|uniref:serine/threonine-protein kinase n=1 Tax=Actinocorallia sp. B10E7 TaxID=3153558 RepID=UPI00325C79A9